MGYYSNFELKVHSFNGTQKTWKDIMEAMKQVMDTREYGFYVFEDYVDEYKEEPEDYENQDLERALETEEPQKWYDCDEDMGLLSKLVPGVIFKLHAEGEEAGDVSDTYFKDGRNHEYRPVMPTFNPEDLK